MFIGEAELESGNFKLKELETSQEQELRISEVIDALA